MIVGVPKETFPGERRVALIPASLPALDKAGAKVVVEEGAGDEAGFPDAEYEEKGAELVSKRDQVFEKADVVVQVRTYGTNPDKGKDDLKKLREGQALIGFLDPLVAREAVEKLAEAGVDAFSMELMPRITRAQSMDALSSMATIAGYKAVLLAADHLPRMFPMMMTAAGTISPARVFVIGAGVAGLQAIASAKKMGAVVRGYDIRPAVKEQVESLGAKFVELPIEAGEAEDKGGYAKAMDEEFYRKQRELMAEVVADSDVVITTAAVPGKKAPVLITADMVRGMKPRSIVVDLAAETGGNCELTKAGETVEEKGVLVLGPVNLSSTVPYHASQMYAKNIVTFLGNMIEEGNLKIDMQDEITSGTLVTHKGEVVHPQVLEAMGKKPAAAAQGKET
jgi:NAD(P) transhydrogenase subunit alpha